MHRFTQKAVNANIGQVKSVLSELQGIKEEFKRSSQTVQTDISKQFADSRADIERTAIVLSKFSGEVEGFKKDLVVIKDDIKTINERIQTVQQEVAQEPIFCI